MAPPKQPCPRLPKRGRGFFAFWTPYRSGYNLLSWLDIFSGMSEATEREDMDDGRWFPMAMLCIALFSTASLLYWVGRLVHLIPA